MSWLFVFFVLFNVFLLSSLLRCCECLGVCWVCVFLRVRVFSPAASIDYGSFADRCSTWLELLRLKAHTIRRGSVKTSRRTHSLAHSGDHTYKFTAVPAHTLSQTHPHTHPSMHASGGGALSVKQSSPGFFGWVWKLKPRPSGSIRADSHDDKKKKTFLEIYLSLAPLLKLTLHTDVCESGREILELGLVGQRFSLVWHLCQSCVLLTKHWSDVWLWALWLWLIVKGTSGQLAVVNHLSHSGLCTCGQLRSQLSLLSPFLKPLWPMNRSCKYPLLYFAVLQIQHSHV